jgi:hypothetical protein
MRRRAAAATISPIMHHSSQYSVGIYTDHNVAVPLFTGSILTSPPPCYGLTKAPKLRFDKDIWQEKNAQ